MQQIIYFIRKFRYFLLFVLLEIVAVFLTIQHHSFHSSKIVNSANFISGSIYDKMSTITDFFHLKTENKNLIEENIRLKNLLEKKDIDYNTATYQVVDTNRYYQKYEYSVAKVIRNDFTKRNNFLTINKGTSHGLSTDLGVVNSSGIIGVIKNVSSNFATVLSILNTNSRINVRLKNSEHFGTLVWDGNDYKLSQIIDIPRQAQIKKGDTIISGGKSAIFPEGIPIGIIKDFKFTNNQYQDINVLLINDMSAIGYVQIVKNLQKNEQINLEQITENE